MRSRRAAALLLGLLAAAGLAVALAARLLPLGEEALERRALGIRKRAAESLRRDAERLAATARKLSGDPAFVEIVEGGSAGVRPGRLFSLLGAALPKERGWGVVLLDRNGDAVAWAGEPGDIPPMASPRAGPFAAAFRVTQFTLAHESPVGRSPETRGLLFVTRRFPTGIVRPDLIEMLGLADGATTRRLRVRAATTPGHLLAVDLEPVPARDEDEDVRRAAARLASVLGAAAALLLGLVARFPATGAVAARLLLLLGAPSAQAGPFAPFDGADPGLFATPVDMALTGLVALLLLRSVLLADFSKAANLPLRIAAGAAGVGTAALPALVGVFWGESAPSLLLGLGLFTGGQDSPLASAGLVASSAATLGLAATLLAKGIRPGRFAIGLGIVGTVFAVSAFFADASPGTAALLLAGSVLLVASFAESVSSFRTANLLSKAIVVALLVGAGALVTGAGASRGRLERADLRLAAAANLSDLERERLEEEGPAAWEERVARPELRPWAPAGSLTHLGDLARALWMRGRDAAFPEPGDLLTVRDEEGRVVSSFGRMRPGDEGQGTAIGLRLPLLGATGVLSRAPNSDPDEEDPLLVAMLGERAHAGRAIERVEFDASGRPLGRGRLERSELAVHFLEEARRRGEAWGTETSAARRFRVTVRRTARGFVVWGVELPTPVFALGSAVASAQMALPFALAILVGGELAAYAAARSTRRKGERTRLFGTFRGRLALALLVSGALPLAGGAVMVRTALDRTSARATERHALQLLTEGRRILEERVEGTPSPAELNRAASVVGVDLLLYRGGVLVAASRAVPVAAGLAPERLASRVAAALANGASQAAATGAPLTPGGRRVAEAAVTLSREERTTLAVTLGEDPAGREAADALVLLAVGAALGALALGGRGALSLSRPVEDLVAAAETVGAGASPGPIRVPETVDLARLVVAFETMSGRIRERTELLEQEREAAVSVLRSLTPAALLFREEDGRIVFANPAADALLPKSDSLSGRLPTPRFAPVLAALRHPRPFETRVTLPVDAGETVLRVVVADLPPDASGRRTVLLLEDLTDFTRAERLEAWVEAARAVAHDIKNPLTPIRLTAERLLRGTGRKVPLDNERVAESAATILRQVDILTERAGRLSRFASPAAPERTRLSGEDLEALLREVASDYASHATVKVSWRAEPGLPEVFVDRALLRDAVSNFVLNASEALEGRGGEVLVAARGVEGAGLEVSCEDDGPGVPDSDLPRLFDPSFSTKSRGSGMGLAAARRAVEEHGGRLFAERSDRGGLRIGFVLPSAAR